MRICLFCSKELVNKKKDAQFCTRRCCGLLYRKNKLVPNIVKCINCSLEFETMKRSDTKYCSKKCRAIKNKAINQKRYLKTYKENREILKEKSRNYYQKNKNKKEFKERARNYRRKYEENKRKNDTIYKLKKRLRIRLHSAIKLNSKVGSAVKDLGCTVEELKIYLEKKFQPGMNWENWGVGIGKWNIDHIKPLSSFNLTDENEFKYANHYTNLQPLWWIENIRKSNKV